jgi:hypothetical protein
LHDWASNAPRRYGAAFLASKFDLIPRRHRRPDLPRPAAWTTGSQWAIRRAAARRPPALTEALDRIQPRLIVCGHIHSGYGRFQPGVTEIISAALVDNDDELVNPVIEIKL